MPFLESPKVPAQYARGWSRLKLERHDVAPASKSLPAGAKRHLVFVSLGHGLVDFERKSEKIRRELSPGCVAVCPAGLPIRWSWRTRLSYSVLTLDPGFLNDVARRIYDAGPGDFELLPAERNRDFDIATLVDMMGRETVRVGPDSALCIESLASILATHLLRHYGTWRRGGPSRAPAARGIDCNGARKPEPVQRAVRYIHEHHARDIRLHEIASAASLSLHHLSRLFTRSMGTSLHRYLVQVRVQSARAMLCMATRRLSLAEVAAASGFSDQSHLTRHFKRALGMTPGQLTASLANAEAIN